MGLHFDVNPEWVAEIPRSSMRKAQFRLPKVEDDADDGELVLYHFGIGGGGSTQANIDRWIGQIKQPDGRPSKDMAKTEMRDVGSLKVTLLDVTGTYSASIAMMASEQDKPGYRMLAAVVEGEGGPWFFKLVGPENTVSHWQAAFGDMVGSMSVIPG